MASEDSHGGDPLLSYKLINFGILLVILIFAVIRYLVPMLDQRARAIQKELSDSRKQVAEAEAKIKNLEAKLGNFDAELASMRQRLSEERQAESERIAAQTKQLLEKVQAQFALEVENTAKVAEQSLRSFTAQKALELAEARLSAGMQAEAQGQLVRTFVEDLRKVSAN
jgi:F-type H+-transporting ATPase subunit b